MQNMNVIQRLIGGACVSLTLCCASLSAMANPITIHNNTDQSSSCVINNGICSSFLPNGIGITLPHSSNVIPGPTVFSACWANRENCTATVYLTNDCSGDVVGTVVMSTSSGVKSVTGQNGYTITGADFEITIG